MVVASSGWVQNTNYSLLNQIENNNMNTTVYDNNTTATNNIININNNNINNNINNINNNNINNNNNNKMSPKGILICRDNSHAFQDRTLNLDEAVKIGRSVARTRASIDNAIFDCKVLSRNHALLYYKSGKFYLQDTGSSNGTFVNNQRLSTTGSESKAKEVCSGDIVQFGVDVIESTKKVTHGCIIATLKLYLPDGKEAKASRTMYITKQADVTLEDLYKLNQYIQEASRREKVLQSKLTYLQKLVDNMRISASQSWKALIDEDRLLSRVKTVENQLVAYSKNFTEDKIRNELVKLEEEKSQYQNVAKDTLQKLHQEKIELSQKLKQLECRLNETEDECQSFHDISKNTQLELQELAVKYTTSQKNLSQIELLCAEKEQNNIELIKLHEQEKNDIIDKLKIHNKIENYLKNKLKKYRIDTTNIHKELSVLKNYLQKTIDDKLINDESTKDSTDIILIDTVNKILIRLDEIINESDNIDIDNLDDSLENLNNLQIIDSNQKLITSSETTTNTTTINTNTNDTTTTTTNERSNSYEKNDDIDNNNHNNDNDDNNDDDNDETNDRETHAEYILPPTSRRTIVNGNINLDNDKQNNNNNNNNDNDDDNCSETSGDTCIMNNDDTNSSIGDDDDDDDTSDEKSIIENKKIDDIINRDINKLEVRFASDVDGKQLEIIHYDQDDKNNDEDDVDDDETGQGDDSSDSADSPNASFSSVTATNEKDDKDDDIEKCEEWDIDAEEDGEHLEGDYIKTLKPLSSCDRTNYSNITREHILQNFITALESIKGDDNIESQQIVNRELDDIREWFIREPNEQTIKKLKDIYYRTKNDNSRMEEVNEQLVILKEKFEIINCEKSELIKQLNSLKNQCGNMLNATYSVPIQYFAPVAIAFGWMLIDKLL